MLLQCDPHLFMVRHIVKTLKSYVSRYSFNPCTFVIVERFLWNCLWGVMFTVEVEGCEQMKYTDIQ